MIINSGIADEKKANGEEVAQMDLVSELAAKFVQSYGLALGELGEY